MYSKKHPKILYIAEFPPCNIAGGPILINRLFAGYPDDKLTLVSASRYKKNVQMEPKLKAKYTFLTVTDRRLRFGLHRLQALLDWLLTCFVYRPWLIRLIRAEKPDFVMTVAVGQFFYLAVEAVRGTDAHLITIVHDEYVTGRTLGFWGTKKKERYIFDKAMQISQLVYAISPVMKNQLEHNYSRAVMLQMPAVTINAAHIKAIGLPLPRDARKPVKIIFSGSLNLSEDGVRMMREVVLGGLLEKYGLRRDVELHVLSGKMQASECVKHNNSYRVISYAWMDHKRVLAALSGADLLFLPHSFEDKHRLAVQTSMPTKIADYLLAARPILVFGPPYSAIMQYAMSEKFACMESEPTLERLALRAVEVLSCDPVEQKNRLERGARLLSVNHNIDKQREMLIADMASYMRRNSNASNGQ